ncbi:hypothetical protein [Kangiella sp. TOML190]|uniref:hypothetical protein n=1 Tax=Kangiella sp. TOML190 TaxID=2931351 RepID=UPI0020411754|nr:hypothetical protein [Kangiella sp. TOML190]
MILLNKLGSISCIIIATLSISPLYAENQPTKAPKGLTVERAIANPQDFNFANNDNIRPEPSDFTIVNYVLLSNEEGERWVTLTLKNTSSGHRIFDNDQVMALFANGKRYSPYSKSLRFEGKEVQTFALNFGKSKFPILEVYTRD